MDKGKQRTFNGEYTLSTIPRPNRPVRPARKTDISQVDWESVRQKMTGSSASPAWTEDVSRDLLEQTWARRAAQVAQVIEDGESGEQIDIAVIRLGREVYGLDTNYIFDIRVMGSVTRVPRVPDWMAGVTNLRGRIISVLDLQRFLGLPPAEDDSAAEPATPYLVVVETPAMELAILVNEVQAIKALPISQIQESSSAVRGIPADYMRGIVISAQGEEDAAPLLVLDLPNLLADKRLIVHEDIV